MRKPPGLRPDSENEQAVIEFALLFPFIIVLLFVILDFGIAMDRRIAIQHAVREGIRQAGAGVPLAAKVCPQHDANPSSTQLR